MKRICVLTGAGISAESGLKTFRDADGLWEGHDVMEVASVEGWHRNPAKVLQFYNERRQKLNEVAPNAGHLALIELEKHFDTIIITQNVDNLHEQAGSSNIIHLHGELNMVRSIKPNSAPFFSMGDIEMGDKANDGFQLRPHIVWFGEAVPMLEVAIEKIQSASYIIIVGTSMQVYPAASLTAYAPHDAQILYVDPRPQLNYELERAQNLVLFEGPASKMVNQAVDYILDEEGIAKV